MKREMICIGCPLGCQLCAKLTETGEFVSVTGNTCKRGAEYAKTECTDPRRTLTTTLRCADGGVVAVKTEQPIPKERLLEAMKQLNQMIVPLPEHLLLRPAMAQSSDSIVSLLPTAAPSGSAVLF